MTPVVDSSVLIASFLPNDTQHAKAQRKLAALSHIACTEYVILEVVTVLRSRKEGVLANRFLDLVRQGSDVEIMHSTSELFAETAALFRSGMHPKLSFVDTSLVVLSRRYEIITFDGALARAIAQSR